jgi:hypothetical protein
MDKVQRFFNPNESAQEPEGGVMSEVRQSYRILGSVFVF